MCGLPWLKCAIHEGEPLPVEVALAALGAEHGQHVAAFAHLLGRVARADQAISPEESRVMSRIIREVSGLGEAQAGLVLELAQARNADEETIDRLVTGRFSELGPAGAEDRAAQSSVSGGRRGGLRPNLGTDTPECASDR
jgi:Tellurite resistance protein TerB